MPNGYSGTPNYSAQVAAAGSGASSATALSAIFNQVTSGSGGVALPASANGQVLQVVNLTGSSITVYPVYEGTDSVNSTTSYSIPEYTGVQFACYEQGNYVPAFTWSGQSLT